MDVVSELAGAFPAGTIVAGADIEPRYFGDWMHRDETARPLALARPRTTAEVASVMRICHAHGTPVAPQGGRTGLAGGATQLVAFVGPHCAAGSTLTVTVDPAGAVNEPANPKRTKTFACVR